MSKPDARDLVVNLINLAYFLTDMLKSQIGGSPDYKKSSFEAANILNKIKKDKYIEYLDETIGVEYLLDSVKEAGNCSVSAQSYAHSMLFLLLNITDILNSGIVNKESLASSGAIQRAAQELYSECPEQPVSTKKLLRRALLEINFIHTKIKKSHE